MEKSRTLGFDTGDRSDNKYYNSSGTLYIVPPLDSAYLAYMDTYMSKYITGLTKAGTVPPGVIPPVGSQTVQGSTRAKPLFNSFRNVKLKGYSFPYLLVAKLSSNSTYVYQFAYFRKPIPSGTNYSQVSVSPPSWAAAEDAQRRAWWSMQPRFEGEVSMLNFIYELKDFKDVLHLMGRTPYGWKQKSFRLRSLSNRMIKEANSLVAAAKTITAASKVWAKVWLANAYAVQPLIKDLGHITSQIASTAEAAQEEFSKRGSESQISHYSEALDEGFIGTWDPFGVWFTGFHSKTKFTASLMSTYKYELREGMDLFKRYWGLNVTAGVIWEAIPFSFLVDYFCKVGNAIDNMQTDPNVTLNATQYCESLYKEATSGLGIDASSSNVHKFYSPSNGHVGLQPGYTPICGVEATFYERVVTSPNKGAALPRFTCPSNRQATNMLALVRGLLK